jgi:hypothetical protein
MNTIVNPTPIANVTFGGYWITSFALSLPAGAPGFLNAQFQPYDGSSHVLGTGGESVAIRNPSSNTAAAALIAALQAEVQRQAASTTPFCFMQLIGRDPSKPVRAQAFYPAVGGVKPAPFVIADIFAKAASDATFAAVLASALSAVAGLAGLTVSS